MITGATDALEQRASRMAAEIARRAGGLADTDAAALDGLVGGGSAPERRIESRGVEIAPRSRSAGEVAARMLSASPPVVVRTRESKVVIDLRTVFPEEDASVIEAVVEAVEGE